jgi:hypothetical protein
MENNILADVISTVLDSENPVGDPAKALYDIRLESMARLLHVRIAGMPAISDEQACKLMLDGVSENEAERLLCSPALCEILRRGDQETSLMDILAVALSSGNGRFMDAWSVMGDSWLGQTRPWRYPFLDERDGRFWAPRLGCGVPVDLSLCDRVMVPSAGLRQPQSLAGSDLVATLSHLDCALDILSETYPLGYQTFAGLVSNVVLRHDAARPIECWGATSGIAIGRVVVVNALAQPDARMLGEILLHEATHCAIDCAELVNPLWCGAPSQRSRLGVPATSPWTFNDLTPHALAHACVVWAVLLRYWAACESRYGADDISRARRSFIARGFFIMDEHVDLKRALAPLATVALDAVTVAKQGARVIG